MAPYKTTISRMLRDKFGAKDPPTRNAKNRSLLLDVVEIKKHLEEYSRESAPTRINCIPVESDSSDSNDSNREDVFSNFFLSNGNNVIGH